MPEHQKKGVIHDKILYKNEEVYIVDPTGAYDPIQRHVIRQHEIYNYVSQKTLEDFNYNLALSLAKDDDDEHKQHQQRKQRKHAKRQHKMKEYNPPSQSSGSRLGRQSKAPHSEEQATHPAPKRDAWDQDLENQLIFDSTDTQPASSNRERYSNNHGRKRLKLQQEEQPEVIDLVGSDDDLDVISVKSRKQSEQPSLSAAFRSSQRSHHQISDDEDTSMGETVQVDTSRKSSTKQPIKAAKTGRVDNKSASEISERKNSKSQIVEDDEADTDELNTFELNPHAHHPLVATTPKKSHGIFKSSPSTPGTGRSHKSLHEQIITPILEEREREQSRQSASLESPSRNRSARLSRSSSKDPLFDGVLRTSRRSTRIPGQSRTSSSSTQVLPQSTKPDTFVRSSSPNPFVTSKNRAEDATMIEAKDVDAKEARQLRRKEKKRRKEEQQKAAAILATQAVEEPPPFDEEQEYEIKGLLGDKMRKKNGKMIRYFLVDWVGSYDPTWEPADFIDEHVREEYFRDKIMAESSDEAQSSHSLGFDGAMDTKNAEQDGNTQHYTDDMDVQMAIRDENDDTEMGDGVIEADMIAENKSSEMETRNDKHSTANLKRDSPSLLHRKNSISVKSPNAFPTSHQFSVSPGLAGNGHKLHTSSSKKGYSRTINIISESEADQYPAQLFDPHFDPHFDQDIGAGTERRKSRDALSRKFFPKATNKSGLNLGAGEDERIEGTPVVGELADDEASDIEVMVDDDIDIDLDMK